MQPSPHSAQTEPPSPAATETPHEWRPTNSTISRPGQHTTTGQAEIYFLMMLRNETSRFERWLRHYAALTPYDHLIVFDNLSTRPETLRLLELAEAQGVRVVRNIPDYRTKGIILLEAIQELDRTVEYDFAIPVDCDEYLGVFTDHAISMKPEDVHAHLLTLVDNTRALRIPISLFNDPEDPHLYWPNRDFYKGFVPSKTIRALDHGHHEPESAIEPGYDTTRLFYLHEHNLPWEEWRELALAKLESVVDTSNPEALAGYLANPTSQTGQHLLEDLRGGPEKFRTKYRGRLRIFFSETFPDLISIHQPDGTIFPWNGQTYLKRNPDVASDPVFGALMHYIHAGAEEGRATT